MAEDWEYGGFGIYVHWPFCAAKCPYCDFNSHVRPSVDHAAWADALVEEIDKGFDVVGDRIVRSVFFGGGTPSLMEPDTVARILDQIAKRFRQTNQIEVTLESNPTSVEMGKFQDFRKVGVNRISMGVQALNDSDLRRLGRMHSVAEARAAFDIARSTFDRVSFDLIYARQDQTLAQWEAELTSALEMAVDHLSLYQLTIEPGTVFGTRHARGQLRGLPSEDLGADMFELTQDICEGYGMPAYEVSNHAKPDAQSQHNLVYWRYGDYLGIGPGAHGRVTTHGARFATEEERMPEAWLNGSRRIVTENLTQDVQAWEMALMGLRLREGISRQRLEELQQRPVDQGKVQHLIEIGLIESDSERIIVLKQGVMVLNAIIPELFDG
ncbi:MAG: coproporphyrinogen III oxidase [Rhodobacteraceae bacterium]|nr:coproporphyrinogen III oxidase [Paracoccaceae bacterium]